MSPVEWLTDAGTLLLLAAIPLFPLELWRRWRAGRLNWAVVREMAASASPFLPTLALGGVTLSYILGLYSLAAMVAPFAMATGWSTALACLVLVDFLYYVDHRCGHRVRAYWAISHSVHHSSPQYDQTTGLRVSFIDGFLAPWFYLPAVLIGFDPLLVLACLGFILSWQQWLHTESVGRLGWLDFWLNTPSNHRVHHGVQDAYLDRNYGAVLMVWDHLFGTYQAETEAPRYGLTMPIDSSNPVRVHLAEAISLWRDLRHAPSWRRRWELIWSPPGA